MTEKVSMNTLKTSSARKQIVDLLSRKEFVHSVALHPVTSGRDLGNAFVDELPS